MDESYLVCLSLKIKTLKRGLGESAGGNHGMNTDSVANTAAKHCSSFIILTLI